MQNDSWTEGTGTPAAPTTTGITFSSLPSFTSAGDESLGTFSFAGGTSGTATYTLSLTPGFLADASAGNLVSFRLFAADSAVSYLFDSRSFGTASARPLLTVVAVPEPGALPLLAVGAACCSAQDVAAGSTRNDPASRQPRLHPHRAARRHRYHRDPGGAASAGPEPGPGQSPGRPMRQQPPPVGPRLTANMPTTTQISCPAAARASNRSPRSTARKTGSTRCPPTSTLQPYQQFFAANEKLKPRSSSVFVCPAATDPGSNHFLPYGMNMNLCPWNLPQQTKFAEVAQPSQVVAMADAPGPYASTFPSTKPYSVLARHAGRVNHPLSRRPGELLRRRLRWLRCRRSQPRRRPLANRHRQRQLRSGNY